MPATPRKTLKAVQALHGRSVTLLADFEVVMPAAYRERSDGAPRRSTSGLAAPDLLYDAWHASRRSLTEAAVDLAWLASLLGERMPPPTVNGTAHVATPYTARDDDAGHVARDGP
jgi:hypothetical protein